MAGSGDRQVRRWGGGSTPWPCWWASVACGELRLLPGGGAGGERAGGGWLAGLLLPRRSDSPPFIPALMGHSRRRPSSPELGLRSEQTEEEPAATAQLYLWLRDLGVGVGVGGRGRVSGRRRDGALGRSLGGAARRRSDFPREGPVLDLLRPALHLGRRGREAGGLSAPPASLTGSPRRRGCSARSPS